MEVCTFENVQAVRETDCEGPVAVVRGSEGGTRNLKERVGRLVEPVHCRRQRQACIITPTDLGMTSCCVARAMLIAEFRAERSIALVASSRCRTLFLSPHLPSTCSASLPFKILTILPTLPSLNRTLTPLG